MKNKKSGDYFNALISKIQKYIFSLYFLPDCQELQIDEGLKTFVPD